MEELRVASLPDTGAIAALLQRCGLPTGDIEPHLAHFVVAAEGEALVGVIGLEVHGTVGLLRSLAVDEERRGQGIARRLYAAVLRDAHRLGLERLYCLTTVAEGFLEMLGFRAIEHDEVPDAIRATEEFRVLCPSTAVCMSRILTRG